MSDSKIPFIHLKKVTSTNEIAADFPIDSDMYYVFSDEQTKGRGRYRERKWFSPSKSGLYLSIVTKGEEADIIPENLIYITNITALAVVEALREVLKVEKDLYIKEPNDIYYLDKKISGVLAESSSKGNTVQSITAGVGVNIKRPEKICLDIEDKAIYLSDIIEKKFDFEEMRSYIIDLIIKKYLNYYDEVRANKLLNINKKFKGFLI